MSPRIFLAKFVRWLLTWPILVIVALNLENFATLLGVADVLPKNQGWIMAVLTWMVAAATIPWVSYTAVFLLGWVAYEWFVYFTRRLEMHNPWVYRFVTRSRALIASQVFLKDGFHRRSKNARLFVEDVNERLEHYGLPTVPDFPGGDDAVNKVYAGYLGKIAEGDFKFAKTLLDAFSLYIRAEHQKSQLLQSTEEETQL